jgi:translation initiation factor 4E
MTDPATDQPEPIQLNNKWTMWFDNPRMADPDKEWKENLTNCGTFDTVESFWRVFNNLKPASQLDTNSNYHVFREGVIPMWEDPENENGGKFVLTMPKADSKAGRCDEWWLYSVLAIIGETLDLNGNEVCGAVVSIRSKQDRIALWLKTNDKERCSAVGARWKKCLEMNRTILKFQEHKLGKRCMLLRIVIAIDAFSRFLLFALHYSCGKWKILQKRKYI